jgi:predicted Zn-dependent protease
MNKLIMTLLAVVFIGMAGSAAGQSQPLSKDEQKLAVKYDISRLRGRGVGRGLNMFTTRDEIELGQDMAEEIEANAKLVDDPELLEFVQQLGKRLVQHSDAELPMRFKIVESDEINAFALPNGVVYVTTGLLLAADGEAELAGVLSHEIAHVAAHHGSRNDSKRQLLGFANLAVTMLSGGLTQAVAQPVLGLTSMSLSLKFDRDAEREADLLGLEYEYLSGYDPAAFISFLERIEKQDSQKSKWLDRMLATHPATSERIARAQRAIQILLPPKDDYIVDSSEFQATRERLAQIEARRLGVDIQTRPVLRKIALQAQGELSSH